MNQLERMGEKLVARAKRGKTRTSLLQWYAGERISGSFSKDDYATLRQCHQRNDRAVRAPRI